MLDSLDWEKVGNVIESYGLRALDADSVLKNVARAAAKWLPMDRGKKLLSCEREFRRDGLKGIADLVLLEEPDGSKTVIDWKTTGKVGPAWRRRHANAWQGPWYGFVAGPGVRRVIFRGIERSSGRGDQVEVLITPPVLQGVLNHCEVTEHLRKETIIRFPIRRGGYACVSFDQECPYLGKRCDEGGVTQMAVNMTITEMDALLDAPLSPSSAERIWNCPHKNTLYQLDKLRGNHVPDDSSDASNYGNAFHAGIAEVYKQVLV